MAAGLPREILPYSRAIALDVQAARPARFHRAGSPVSERFRRLLRSSSFQGATASFLRLYESYITSATSSRQDVHGVLAARA